MSQTCPSPVLASELKIAVGGCDGCDCCNLSACLVLIHLLCSSFKLLRVTPNPLLPTLVSKTFLSQHPPRETPSIISRTSKLSLSYSL